MLAFCVRGFFPFYSSVTTSPVTATTRGRNLQVFVKHFCLVECPVSLSGFQTPGGGGGRGPDLEGPCVLWLFPVCWLGFQHTSLTSPACPCLPAAVGHQEERLCLPIPGKNGAHCRAQLALGPGRGGHVNHMG